MPRRAALPILLLAFALASLAASAARAADASHPVVVELFTSQGCSSCPPADNYLADLVNRPDVLALSFHVDYWDYIGWKDPFANHLATSRQRQYSHNFKLSYIYTPQMVVDGVSQGVGSDRGDIEEQIAKAKTRAGPRPGLAIERRPDGAVIVHVGAAEAKRPATVWLVCFDREHSTAVKRGENAGATLVNYHVVRDFESLGTWKGAALDVPVPPAEVAAFVDQPNRGLAVLLQVDGAGPILAAQALPERR